MGTATEDPDIIALYIGSNDLAKVTPAYYGTVEEVDFDALISRDGDGFVYAEPKTVAEAYCILLHKLQQNYPAAEIYCFTVVPHSNGTMEKFNQRLSHCIPFNGMVKGVADHFGATVVDLYAAFGIDPNMDGEALPADKAEFDTCFLGDPHPNAKGFDVITRCFVDTVMTYSRFTARAETTPGVVEAVEVDETRVALKGGMRITRTAKGFVTESGMLVDFNSLTDVAANGDVDHEETYIATDRNGLYRAEGGRELSVEHRVPAVSVRIPLTAVDDPLSAEDETTRIADGQEPAVVSQTGDPKQNAADGVYDVTRISITGQGAVSVHTEQTSLVSNVTSSTGSAMTLLRSNVTPTATNDLIMGVPQVTRPTSAADAPKIPAGYDCVLIGSDQHSVYWAAFASRLRDEAGFPGETPIYTLKDGSGLYVWVAHKEFTKRGLVVPNLFLKEGTVVLETMVPARYESIQQFILAFANGSVATTYCADRGTPTVENYVYVMRNVDEADYYSAEEANMIRTVARNGYWGAESGYGSLAAVKNMMRQSDKFTAEEVEAMTDGIAMTATQYAVWTYSNVASHMVFLNAYHANAQNALSQADQADVALLMKLYHHLTSLAPTVLPDSQRSTQNTIINEQNFLKQVTLTLRDKPATMSVNQDDDAANDVYVADLSFQLAVRPAMQEGDELVMTLRGSDGETLAVGRIMGALRPGEVQLTADDNGVYTFGDVRITEGGQSVSFHLGGTQVLDKDVYFYTSEVRDGVSSQNMVGIAEGPRSVDVSLLIRFDAAVQDERVTVERLWRTEETKVPATGDSATPMALAAALLLSAAAFMTLRRRARA